mgnify:CR=1 FL=1
MHSCNEKKPVLQEFTSISPKIWISGNKQGANEAMAKKKTRSVEEAQFKSSDDIQARLSILEQIDDEQQL